MSPPPSGRVSRRLYTVFLFALLATLWGLSFLAIEIGLRSLEPVLFASFRYALAAVLLLGYALGSRAEWRPSGRPDVDAIVGGGVFLVAGNGL